MWFKMELCCAEKYSTAEVNKKIIYDRNFCRLVIKSAYIAEKIRPGQFILLYLSETAGRILPRPFSVYAANPAREEITLIFEIVGPGTALASSLEQGSEIRVLGPLGSSFPAPGSGSLLLAGGMGIAPIAFLARSTDEPLTLLYAVKSADQLAVSAGDLKRDGLKLLVVSEDGSCGAKGTALDILNAQTDIYTALYGCGPKPMLSCAAAYCRDRGIKAWVCLEEKMACGIGACLGCAVKTVAGYRCVCSDGPVFEAEEVVWDG